VSHVKDGLAVAEAFRLKFFDLKIEELELLLLGLDELENGFFVSHVLVLDNAVPNLICLFKLILGDLVELISLEVIRVSGGVDGIMGGYFTFILVDQDHASEVDLLLLELLNPLTRQICLIKSSFHDRLLLIVLK